MCRIIVINKGEKEIGTPRQFREHFGFDADVNLDNCDSEIELDSCLCQVDCENSLIKNNIPFKTDWGDIYVGMLDEINGD